MTACTCAAPLAAQSQRLRLLWVSHGKGAEGEESEDRARDVV